MNRVVYKFQLPEECLDELTINQCYFHLGNIIKGVLNKDGNFRTHRCFEETLYEIRQALGLHVTENTHEVTYDLDNFGNISLYVRPYSYSEKFINEVKTVIEEGGWVSEAHRRLYEELASR